MFEYLPEFSCSDNDKFSQITRQMGARAHDTYEEYFHAFPLREYDFS